MRRWKRWWALHALVAQQLRGFAASSPRHFKLCVRRSMHGQPDKRSEMPTADSHFNNTSVLLALSACCILHAVTRPCVPTASWLAHAGNRASARSTAHVTGACEQSRARVYVCAAPRRHTHDALGTDTDVLGRTLASTLVWTAVQLCLCPQLCGYALTPSDASAAAPPSSATPTP